MQSSELDLLQRNDMKLGKILLSGIILLAASQTAWAEWYEVDEHGNNRESGSFSATAFVQCLNDGVGDLVTFEVEYTVVVHSTLTPARWMFSQNWRQSGTAYDTVGNMWTWNGHFSAIEVTDDVDALAFTNFHSIEKDILRSPTGPNLILTWTRNIQFRDGVRKVFIRDFSAACL